MQDQAQQYSEQEIQAKRAELLRDSRERHEQLEALIAPLGDEDLTRPGVTDDWSVKDHMAHLTWWEQRVIRTLGGEPDPIDAIPGGSEHESEDEGLNRVNAFVFAANRDRPLQDVRASFQASYQEMLRLIATVPDDVFVARYGWIGGNSAGHYDEHVGMLQAWLDHTAANG